MRESSIVVYGNIPVCFDIGTESNVTFNFKRIWQYRKNWLEEFNKFDPSLLKFYHVHPSGLLWYSSGGEDTDLNCIQALSIAFNYPIYFSIICFKDNYYDVEEVNNIDQISFKFIDGEMKQVDNIVPYPDHLALLMGGSYL